MTKSTVLVVDDEPNVVRLCTRLLERTRHEVVTAGDAGQALKILQNQQIDLLIADIRMPGLDGLHLIAQARRFLPDLAAILMTGYGTLEIAISALQKGVDGLIIKPFSGDVFVQNVDQALEERRRRQEILRLQALRPLFDVSEALFTLRDHNLLVDTLMDATHRILESDFTAFLNWGPFDLEHDPSIGAEAGLQIVDSRGENNFPPDRSVEALIAQLPSHLLRKPALLMHDRDHDPDWDKFLLSSGLGSLISVPVAVQNQGLAILSLRALSKENYTQADLETMILLARQASIAFENARLYDDLANSLKQVERSQSALLHAERLAAAGRLTASIAHEINNPLQALQNCLDLVSRRDLEMGQRQKYLDLAISELNRLMSTVDRMLAFYRPIARDRKLVDLDNVIQRAVDLLRPQFDESAIKVHRQSDPEPLTVMAVADQIQQVLINLLINALEAMPNGGEIWITSRSLTEEAGKTVEVLIEDSGPGIHGEQLEHLFEPLVSNKPLGTGLGLAVSYGIVEAHGGTLKLLTAIRSGACFQIILPKE